MHLPGHPSYAGRSPFTYSAAQSAPEHDRRVPRSPLSGSFGEVMRPADEPRAPRRVRRTCGSRRPCVGSAEPARGPVRTRDGVLRAPRRLVLGGASSSGIAFLASRKPRRPLRSGRPRTFGLFAIAPTPIVRTARRGTLGIVGAREVRTCLLPSAFRFFDWKALEDCMWSAR